MRRISHVLGLLLLLAAIVAIWHSGIIGQLNWATVARHEAALQALVAAHPIAAPAAFVITYALVVAFSVPEAALVTVTGGLLFGTVLGGALAVIGSTLGAVILFLIARTAFADLVARRARGLIERLRPGLERDGFSYLLALRLVPVVPFWLVNLGAALCGMRLFPYAAATLLGVVPATFVFAWIGSGVRHVLAAGGRPDLTLILSPHIIGPMLALAALSLTPVVWRRIKGRDA